MQLRVWLVPCTPDQLARYIEGGGGAQSVAGLPSERPPPSGSSEREVVLPSDPVPADVDLDMDLERDLAFPFYSYIGAGAFGQVGGWAAKAALPLGIRPPALRGSRAEVIRRPAPRARRCTAPSSEEGCPWPSRCWRACIAAQVTVCGRGTGCAGPAVRSRSELRETCVWMPPRTSSGPEGMLLPSCAQAYPPTSRPPWSRK